jgi:hypothetical protein
MTLSETAPYIASGLITFVGVMCGLGGKALWKGNPDSWEDVIANDAILRRVAIGLVLVSTVLITAGITVFIGAPWAREYGSFAILFFAVCGFPGNFYLFGDIRPAHTGTNVVIAGIVLWLLWQ